MIYKAFAAVTLVAAPIIVLTVQSFVPQTNRPEVPATATPGAASVAPPAPPPQPVDQTVNETASFGQPMQDAGRPFLAPGAGLPNAAAPPSAPVENGRPDEVPE